jgi:DHA1 family bicyclomycin/chloramphenicol resistance-like MFS transporter
MTQSTASVRLVVILGAISAFAPLSIDMYLPAFAAIRREFGAPVESVQLTLSAFFIGLAAGQLLYGPLSDHFGRKPPLAVGLVLYTLASLGCGLAPDIETLIVMRTLQALGGCSGVIIAMAMVRDLFEPQVGARVLSRLVLVVGVAPIIAPTAGAWIVEVADWRSIFWILTAIGALCLIATTLLPETRPPRGDRPPLALRPMLRDYAALLTERRFLGYAAAVSFAHASLLAYVTAAPFVLIQLYGVSTREFGLLFALNASALILSAQWNAHLLKTYAAEWLLARANLVPPIIGLLLVAVTATQAGGVVGIMVLLFLYLCLMSIIRPNATACALAAHAERAGTASSLIGFLQFALATLAGAFMSLIHDGTGKPMAITMTLYATTGLILYRWLTRRQAPART